MKAKNTKLTIKCFKLRHPVCHVQHMMTQKLRHVASNKRKQIMQYFGLFPPNVSLDVTAHLKKQVKGKN